MRFSKEIKIGLAGILALAILVFGINYLKGLNILKSSSYYYVRFTDIAGLPKSSPIVADGFRIGTVSDIIYDYAHPGNVLVEISVDPSLRIPKGSTAELSNSLLGSITMTLLLANNPRERIPEGDTIPGAVNNGVLGRAEQLLPQVERMMPKLDSILTSLNRILADSSIAATLDNVEAVTASLRTTSRGIEQMMAKDMPRTMAHIGQITENLAALSTDLRSADLAATMAKVDATVDNVRLLTERLEKGQGTAGMLLRNTELYENLNATARDASLLLEDLRAHPKRYVHFSLFGRKDR